jgi:glycosyltransferase involved in cell wall biosynthesis
VKPEKVYVVYVGADETLFHPMEKHVPGCPLEVLFYGSFIPLHGAQTIVEAARIYQGPPVKWCLLGDGPERPKCEAAAVGLPGVVFEDSIPYENLCARIHRADILLGVFGTTQKAGRVIPNKVFQSLAAGRPVITRESEAYPTEARGSVGLTLVPPGDARVLSAVVEKWAAHPGFLIERGRAARTVYDVCFSSVVVRKQLECVMEGLSL